MSTGSTKLVVLGVLWEVDEEGLRQHMSQFGELVEATIIKIVLDRATPLDEAQSGGHFDHSSSAMVDASMDGSAVQVLDGHYKILTSQQSYNLMLAQYRGSGNVDLSREYAPSRVPRETARYRPY